MSLSPGYPSMVENASRSFLNMRKILETDNMLEVKRGCLGVGLHGGVTQR